MCWITLNDATAIIGTPPADTVTFFDSQDYPAGHKDLNACNSYVGNVPGKDQRINLAPISTPTNLTCNGGIGAVLHEMGHAVGAVHEQMHPQAATNMTFRLDRIRQNEEPEYGFANGATAATGQTTETAQTAYDQLSIMHYGPYGFSICGRLFGLDSSSDPKWTTHGTTSAAYWRCPGQKGVIPLGTAAVNCWDWCAVMVDAKGKPATTGQREKFSQQDIEGFRNMYPVPRDIDDIYRTEVSRPATADEIFTDGTDLNASTRSLAQIRQDVHNSDEAIEKRTLLVVIATTILQQ
jgi:hypothetical protein